MVNDDIINQLMQYIDFEQPFLDFYETYFRYDKTTIHTYIRLISNQWIW